MKKILMFLSVFGVLILGCKVYADFPASTLVHPRSGSTFKPGEVVDVKWNKVEGYSYQSETCTECFVKLIIKHNGYVVKELMNVENDGQEVIKIPFDTPVGEYQVYLYWNNWSMGPHSASGEDLVGIYYVITNSINYGAYILMVVLVLLVLLLVIKLNFTKNKKRENKI